MAKKVTVYRKGAQFMASVYGSPIHREDVLKTAQETSPFYEERSRLDKDKVTGEEIAIPISCLVFNPMKIETEEPQPGDVFEDQWKPKGSDVSE